MCWAVISNRACFQNNENGRLPICCLLNAHPSKVQPTCVIRWTVNHKTSLFILCCPMQFSLDVDNHHDKYHRSLFLVIYRWQLLKYNAITNHILSWLYACKDWCSLVLICVLAFDCFLRQWYIIYQRDREANYEEEQYSWRRKYLYLYRL